MALAISTTYGAVECLLDTIHWSALQTELTSSEED